jgi:hypothetical protein
MSAFKMRCSIEKVISTGRVNGGEGEALYRGMWFRAVLKAVPVFLNVMQTVWLKNQGAEPLVLLIIEDGMACKI